MITKMGFILGILPFVHLIMKIFKINRGVSTKMGFILGILPFVLLIGLYITASEIRHSENKDDKILPLSSKLVEGFKKVALEPDAMGDYWLWEDIMWSGRRFVIGLGIILLGIFIGLYMGMFPIVESFLYKFVAFFDKIPAIQILPIIFILFSVGELTKIIMILMGVMPTIILDAHLRTKSIHKEQIIKGITLGATDLEIAHRIVLPQILPDVFENLKLNYKSILTCLIAAESVGGKAGLGYRVFTLMRYSAMYKVIPYVLVTSLLVFLLYSITSWLIKRRYSTWQTGAD